MYNYLLILTHERSIIKRVKENLDTLEDRVIEV